MIQLRLKGELIWPFWKRSEEAVLNFPWKLSLVNLNAQLNSWPATTISSLDNAWDVMNSIKEWNTYMNTLKYIGEMDGK
jgi:hypothetical protein